MAGLNFVYYRVLKIDILVKIFNYAYFKPAHIWDLEKRSPPLDSRLDSNFLSREARVITCL